MSDINYDLSCAKVLFAAKQIKCDSMAEFVDVTTPKRFNTRTYRIY
ncbi:hypothetical protein KBT16_10790 [Nostoc sp. CCCryo 231-06]|nr:hypothetical protein [Nostoc sp. CCCryo 231-06]